MTDAPTIIVRERTITLKQITLANGLVRLEMTIPKDKILFWMRSQQTPSDSGLYVSQDIASLDGKLQMVDTSSEEFAPLMADEIDILTEQF